MGFYPATANMTVAGALTIAGLLTANGGAVVNAPATTTVSGLVVNDTNGGRTGAAQIIEGFDHLGNPIVALPTAGGWKMIGDKMGAWSGVFTESAQLLPWWGIQLGGSAGPTIYGGSGAPLPAGITAQLTAYGAAASAGDFYLRTDATGTADERLYICTVAGNPGTWTGIV